MARRSTILAVTGITVVGLIAYAVYFDHKRRHDGQFRKRLRKEKKIVNKAKASAASYEISPEELRQALEKVKKEKVPEAQQGEDYFMGQVNMGEQLSSKGPSHALQAALCFYKALRVYPSPLELIMIYQKTVPEPIFKLVIALTDLDVSPRSEPAMEPQSLGDDDANSSKGSPSETSSQGWDKVTDPGAQTPAR